MVINDILRGYQHFLTNIIHQWIINQNSLSTYVTALKDIDWDNAIYHLPRENYVNLGLILFLYLYKFFVVILGLWNLNCYSPLHLCLCFLEILLNKCFCWPSKKAKKYVYWSQYPPTKCSICEIWYNNRVFIFKILWF